MARALLLEGPRSVRLRDEPAPALAPREIRVKALLSGISHGTELSLYRGTSAFADRVFDRDLRAFVTPDTPRPRLPGDARLRARRPRRGGRRRRARARARRPRPRRRAAPRRGDARPRRRATSTYPPVRLPEDGPLERWLFVSVGAVALRRRPRRADQARRPRRRDRPRRDRPAARADGAARGRRAASTAVDPVAVAPRARARARRRRGDRSADRAGRRRRGDQTLGRARRRRARSRRRARPPACTPRWRRPRSAARVVTVGFYQGGAPELRLGEEWHHNRLDMVSSMGAWGAPHRAYPAWDRPRVMQHGGRPAGLGRRAHGRAARAPLPLRAGRRRVRLAR